MTLVAAIALIVMGALFSWLLAARFPAARFMRIFYYSMIASGAFGVLYAIRHDLGFGILTVAILLLGGIFGAIGSIRKELRTLV